MATRLHLSLGAETWTAKVSRHDVTLGGNASQRVSTHDGRLQVTTGDATQSGNAVASGDEIWVTVDGEVFVFQVTVGPRGAHHAGPAQDAFSPPMAATVVRIAVKPGDHVEDGDVLIALEAMKMELPIRAPRDGRVKSIACQPGDLVQPGVPLLEIE